jgi:hypothetical protein
MPALAPDTYKEYELQRIRVQQKIANRGRGAQSNASYDLRVPPTRISNILSGQIIDPTTLNSLEEWVDYSPNTDR